jgi:hypothetical protein
LIHSSGKQVVSVNKMCKRYQAHLQKHVPERVTVDGFFEDIVAEFAIEFRRRVEAAIKVRKSEHGARRGGKVVEEKFLLVTHLM